MPKMRGFWSYVHKDDEVDMGRVVALARDIAANYEAIRAEEIELFLDSDQLHWGDDWRTEINESLGNVAFVVPVLTPRYFQSVECRRELQFFLDRTAALGIPQLVMPILYMDVPKLHEDEPDDPLMVAVKQRHWKDWRELRFDERSSGAYRSSVHDLANEIAERAVEAESADIPGAAVAVQDSGTPDVDDQPGLIDRIAALEEAMPRWGETLTEISDEIAVIGEMMRASTEEIQQSPGKGFAGRLVVARRLAGDLEAPVNTIETRAREWLADLDSIDSGVRVLLERADEAYEEDAAGTLTFLRSVRTLSDSANQGLGQALVMERSLGVVADQSRDLRPVLRRLQKALISMAEARQLTDEWATLIDRTELLDGPDGAVRAT
jgi:hypothetical protein